MANPAKYGYDADIAAENKLHRYRPGRPTAVPGSAPAPADNTAVAKPKPEK